MQKKKFTLVELIIVITIIAILAAMLFPLFGKMQRKALQTHSLNLCKQHNNEIIANFNDIRKKFLPDLDNLSSYGTTTTSKWLDSAGGGNFGYPVVFNSEADSPNGDTYAFNLSNSQYGLLASATFTIPATVPFMNLSSKGNNGKKPDEDDHENPGGNYDNRDKEKDSDNGNGGNNGKKPDEDDHENPGGNHDNRDKNNDSDSDDDTNPGDDYHVYDSIIQERNSDGLSDDGIKAKDHLSWSTYNNDEKVLLTTKLIWNQTQCQKPVAYGDGHAGLSGVE